MRVAALALMVAGCASLPSGVAPLGVGQAWQRGDELDGLMISIEGVASGCDLEGCHLLDRSGDGPAIRVGGSAAFANAMRRATGRTVIVRGRFNATCLRGSMPKAPTTGFVSCTAAGTPVRNARLVTVL